MSRIALVLSALVFLFIAFSASEAAATQKKVIIEKPRREKPAKPAHRKPADIREELGKQKEPLTKTATYKNSVWIAKLDKYGTLLCYGAGHGDWGTNDGIVVAQGVDSFWIAGSWRGPVVVFCKGNSYYTQLLRYDTGGVVASGQVYPGGQVASVTVNGRTYGAHIYFNLANGKQTTYSVWQHPNLPGKVEKGIKH